MNLLTEKQIHDIVACVNIKYEAFTGYSDNNKSQITSPSAGLHTLLPFYYQCTPSTHIM